MGRSHPAKETAAHKSVSIFTHTHATTAELSTELTTSGVLHEQVGFTLRWALLGEAGARVALAVYVRSISRGNREKQVAGAIVRKSMPIFEAELKGIC